MRWEASPDLFWKSKKGALILGKKALNILVKYSIQTVVLRVSTRANFNTFPAGDIFSHTLSIEVP